MRLLFDQNISHRIMKLLPDLFENSNTVKSLGLVDATDKYIWEYARKYEYTIVTLDSDFNDLNSVLGFLPKIIWLRTGNLKTKSIATILIENLNQINSFLEDENYGCFELFHVK